MSTKDQIPTINLNRVDDHFEVRKVNKYQENVKYIRLTVKITSSTNTPKKMGN